MSVSSVAAAHPPGGRSCPYRSEILEFTSLVLDNELELVVSYL